MEEEHNTVPKKRARNQNAQPLPPELPDELPKYVTYHADRLNDKLIEYFRIRGHPSNPKVFCSSKSTKKNVLEKYQEILHMLERLNLNLAPKTYVFPVGVSFGKVNDTFHFVLNHKRDDIVYNMKMVWNHRFNFDENLQLFLLKIAERYPDLHLPERK